MREFHEIEWTPEKVKFFWDALGKATHLSDLYFTKQVGSGILKLVGKNIPLKGNILDFGAGRGFLSEKLLKLPETQVTCYDYSQDSIEQIKKNLATYSNFKGAFTSPKLPIAEFSENKFDIIFFLETIEHLIDENYQQTLKELHRLLKPGGYLVLTTPNSENLEENKVLCPDCGAYFHKFQHVRSFSPQSLTSDLEQIGFKTHNALTTDFYIYTAHFLSPLWIKKTLRRWIMGDPNLLYIGRKSL